MIYLATLLKCAGCIRSNGLMCVYDNVREGSVMAYCHCLRPAWRRPSQWGRRTDFGIGYKNPKLQNLLILPTRCPRRLDTLNCTVYITVCTWTSGSYYQGLRLSMPGVLQYTSLASSHTVCIFYNMAFNPFNSMTAIRPSFPLPFLLYTSFDLPIYILSYIKSS